MSRELRVDVGHQWSLIGYLPGNFLFIPRILIFNQMNFLYNGTFFIQNN